MGLLAQGDVSVCFPVLLSQARQRAGKNHPRVSVRIGGNGAVALRVCRIVLTPRFLCGQKGEISGTCTCFQPRRGNASGGGESVVVVSQGSGKDQGSAGLSMAEPDSVIFWLGCLENHGHQQERTQRWSSSWWFVQLSCWGKPWEA